MTYKHKMHSVNSNGKIVSNMDTNFYIDDVSLINQDCPSIVFS